MTSADSKTYLANGGYLQKGENVNICEAGLQKDVQDLLPSRSVERKRPSALYKAVELILELQMVSRRKDFSVGKACYIFSSRLHARSVSNCSSLKIYIVLAQRFVQGRISKGW
jgi:hypothetical protein